MPLGNLTGSSDECLSVNDEFRFRVTCPIKLPTGASAGPTAQHVTFYSESNTCGGIGMTLPLGCINDDHGSTSALYTCAGTHATYQSFSLPNCQGTPLLQQITASGECGVGANNSSYTIQCSVVNNFGSSSGAAGVTVSVFALLLVAVNAFQNLRL
jgi:hypothetical protein